MPKSPNHAKLRVRVTSDVCRRWRLKQNGEAHQEKHEPVCERHQNLVARHMKKSRMKPTKLITYFLCHYPMFWPAFPDHCLVHFSKRTATDAPEPLQ